MIALFTATPQAAIAGSAVPKVVVTVAPLKPVADAILAGITHATLLARPGQDAHQMILSPSQARALAEAEIILLPTRSMNSSLGKLAERYEKKGAVVISLDELPGADFLPYDRQQPWLDAKEKKKEKNAKADKLRHDPHVWLDPLRMAALAMPLAEAIAAQAPSHRPQLLANAAQWQQHVREELHPRLQALLKPGFSKKRYDSRPFIPFVTDHSAYQYFLQRYGIANPGALMQVPEDVMGARSGHDVLARAEKVTIGCIIAEQETPLVRKVATSSGARLVLLNPEQLPAASDKKAVSGLHDGYDQLLYRTATVFKGCL